MPVSEASAETLTVRGALTYRERVALRPGSVATLSVADHAVADRTALPIAEDSFDFGGAAVPVPFALDVPRVALEPLGRPGLRAVIRDENGALVRTTDTFTPVMTDADLADVGEVVLVRAAGPSGPSGAAADAPLVAYDCGGTPVRVRYEGDGERAVLLLGPDAAPTRYALDRGPAASGSLYEAVTDRGRVAFRAQGEEARLSVNGKDYPRCVTGDGGGTGSSVAAPAASDLAGLPWMIEDVAGMGVVDASAPRITFAEDGTLSGRTGCNDFSGGYELSGARLTVGQVALTRKMCPEALMRQEQRIVGVLSDASSVAAAPRGEVVISAPDDRSITLRR